MVKESVIIGMNRLIKRIKLYFTPADDEAVYSYRFKVPNVVRVLINDDGDSYIAKIEEIDGVPITKDTILTESSKKAGENGIIDSVNDALYTYLEFPENIKRKMPQLIPAEFIMKKHKNVTFAGEVTLIR